MKKAISILLAMGLAVSSLTGCSSEEPKTDTPAPESTADETGENTEGAAATEAADAVHLTLAHADTETGSLFGECMTEFKQKVEEASGGSIIIDIYPNGQLGTVAEYVAGIQNGSIDLAPGASTFVANFCTGVSVFDLPFLFENYDHVWASLDSEVGDSLTEELQNNGIEPLVWFGLGFRNVTTSEGHPINTLEDFKGFRIRTMTSAIHQSLFQALGADAVPMDWGELYTALQQGTVDGEENPFSQVLSSNIWEVNNVIVKSEHAFTPAVFMMSPKIISKLTEEQVEILRTCAEECTPVFRQKVVDMNDEALTTLVEEKKCVYVESLDKAALQAATESVYGQFPEYAEMVEKIRSLR